MMSGRKRRLDLALEEARVRQVQPGPAVWPRSDGITLNRAFGIKRAFMSSTVKWRSVGPAITMAVAEYARPGPESQRLRRFEKDLNSPGETPMSS